MSRIAYRADIDGLRAIAVVSVLGYHLGLTWMSGGYVGVDIFFVISGYLITSIIEKDLDNGTFSFAAFYAGRVRRLLPALFVVIFFSMCGASLLMVPADLELFASSVIGALLSVSNFVFYFEAGYWDSASELKPLLHTWSLGVEEQFYLLWPAFLVGIFYLGGKKWIGWSLIVICLLNVPLSQWAVAEYPDAAFYLLPFRIFEFCLGGIALHLARKSNCRAFLANSICQNLLLAIAILAMVYSVTQFDEHTPFPGLVALIPCLAAVGFIFAGEKKLSFYAAGALTNPFMLWVGKISYSLYLVHWPVLAFYRYKFGADLNWTEQLVLAIAIVALAQVMHVCVEQRFRKKALAHTDKRPWSPAGFTLGVVALAYAGTLVAGHIKLSDGWEWRFPRIAITLENQKQAMRNRYANYALACDVVKFVESSDCVDNPQNPVVLVIGNSHEVDGYNFLKGGYGRGKSANIVKFGNLNHCKGLRYAQTGWTSSSQECVARLNALFEPKFIDRLEAIVYSSNRPFSKDKKKTMDLLASIKVLKSAINLVAVGGYINVSVPCSRLVNEFGNSSACREKSYVTYYESEPFYGDLGREAEELFDWYIDRVELLCEKRRLDRCVLETPDGKLAFYDAHHWSREFAEMAGAKYAKITPLFFNTILP